MILGQGAEAIIRKKEDTVLKERFPKSYRHPLLDKKLRQFRTRREAKVLEKLSELGFLSPQVQNMDDKNMEITMDFIEGSPLRDVFGVEHCTAIGEQIAILHKNDIIHGDLTTSNMILKEKDLYFIDFGLSFFSQKVEDKAVDLHLLDRALESKHYETYPENIEKVFSAYLEAYPEAKAVMKRYEIVKNRGRNKAKG